MAIAERVDQLVGPGRGVRHGREQRDPAPGGGRGGERVAGPALGAGERVEGGGLGQRVAGAVGELDRPLGAGDRLRYGVVGRALGGAERVGEHPGLGQRHRGLGGRVVAGQLARLGR